VGRRGLWAKSIDLPWPKLSEAALVGNKNSKKYHRPDCSAVEKIALDNRVEFDDADAAQAAGYEPCKLCKP
jgi:methylphosphotriester-DNA--protein-cysteine methyltransferase